MADYKSSENKCGDCKHYEKKHRRCYLKSKSEFIADLCPACADYEERNEEMSVRKSCENCAHEMDGVCVYGMYKILKDPNDCPQWTLSGKNKADVLHDAETEHDIPKYRSCKLYINGSCENAKIFADKPGVKLDCSKCKSYIRGYYKLPTNTPTETEHDAVSHPSHYTSGVIECIDCIKAALGEKFIGFLIGNVIKYTYRYKDKNGAEDLKKARWYIDRAIKEIENDKVD